MKKWIILVIGLVITLSFAGVTFAQEKAKAPKPEAAKPEPAKPEAPKPEVAKPEAPKPEEKKAEVKKEPPPKPVVYRMGGVVVSVDSKANKLTVQQQSVKKQKKVTLAVSKKMAKTLADLQPGDAVNLTVTGNQVTELVKVF